MSLLDRITAGRTPARMTLDDYGQLFNSYTYGLNFGQPPTMFQTLAGSRTERPSNTFEGLAAQAFAANGVVFACMMVRQLVFSSIRFQFQRFVNGKPSETFGDRTLSVLERPWPGGTTQDLLSRMIQDADLAGNSYWVRDGDELVRLRPDWVQIVGVPRSMDKQSGGRGAGQVGWKKAGYIYTEGGIGNGDGVPFTVDEVVHFAPTPDPLAVFAGMSWITPVLRELAADQAMTKHQSKFFDRGATVNMIIKHSPLADPDAVRRWADEMQSKHGGVDNAWKNLNLYPGADATPVGSNMKDIDFSHSGIRQRSEAGYADTMRVLERAPDDTEARRGLALCLSRTGRLEEAMTVLRRLLADSPDDAVAHNYLGACLADRGRLPEAAEHFRRAAALDPADRGIQDNLERVERDLRRYQGR